MAVGATASARRAARAGARARGGLTLDEYRRLHAAVALPPSSRRMWLYLVCGAIPFVGGVLLATTPGGGNGVLPLVVGTVNLVIGTRIALRRRRATTTAG